MECIEHTGTEIQEFYRGANVFVTGGTGFMGKVLTEKLLRSCPDVNNIYLLIRNKKGKDVDTRMEEIFDDPLFNKLKEQTPKFRHKVIAVNGDCNQNGLGLCTTDRSRLIEDINIIFHGAATVRFDEKLRLAVGINVTGTKNVLDLARQMSKLKAVIHVSTAYCNCHLNEIDEKFYKYSLTSQKLTNIVDGVDDKVLESMTSHLLGNWPNTYAFTKAMAEDLVREQGVGLPIGVFRPAIVVATRDEPVCGWIDNVYGPTGVFVGAGTGLIKTLHCDGTRVANLVPVDMAVNALIASSWEVANRPRTQTEDDIPIYNYVSSEQKPLTWAEFMDKTSTYGLQIPTVRAVWSYSFRLNKHRSLHLFYTLLLHYLPALIIDGVAMLFGKQPKLVKIYKKISKFSDVISYFCNRDWKFTNHNVQELWKKMGEEDKRVFDFNIDSLDWDRYFYGYVRGVRQYLLKDDLSTVPQGTVRNTRLYWLHQGTKVVLIFILMKSLFAILNSFT